MQSEEHKRLAAVQAEMNRLYSMLLKDSTYNSPELQIPVNLNSKDANKATDGLPTKEQE